MPPIFSTHTEGRKNKKALGNCAKTRNFCLCIGERRVLKWITKKQEVGRGEGGPTLHSSASKWGTVPRSRKTTINVLRQFQQYALKIDKHLNCITTNNILSYMFRLQWATFRDFHIQRNSGCHYVNNVEHNSNLQIQILVSWQSVE